jgi:hypothetical protein
MKKSATVYSAGKAKQQQATPSQQQSTPFSTTISQSSSSISREQMGRLHNPANRQSVAENHHPGSGPKWLSTLVSHVHINGGHTPQFNNKSSSSPSIAASRSPPPFPLQSQLAKTTEKMLMGMLSPLPLLQIFLAFSLINRWVGSLI